MTTKETFDFNLQLFALPTDEPATIKASNGTISIEGNNGSHIDTAESSTTMTLAELQESVGGTASSDGLKVTTSATVYTRVDSDTNVWSFSTSTTFIDAYVFGETSPYEISTGSASVASGLNTALPTAVSTIKGGEYTEGLVLAGVGTVTLDSNDLVELKANGNVLNLTDIAVGEEIEVAPEDGVFNQTVADAKLFFSASNVSMYAVDSASGIKDDDKPADEVLTKGVVLSADENVSLGSIDGNQAWLLSKGQTLTYKDVKYTAQDGLTAIGDENADGVIDIATFDEENAVSVSGETTVNFNDRVVVLKSAATLAGEDTLSANGSAVALDTDAKATVSANGITAVDAVAAKGNWSLGSVTEVTLGNEAFDFAQADAVITADSTGTAASGLKYNGTASLHSASNKSLNVESITLDAASGKAAWNIVANDASATVGLNDDGSVILTNNATATFTSVTGGAEKIKASGANSSLTLTNGGHITVDKNGNITDVANIDANSDWALSSQTKATLGNETFAFSSESAVITADSTGNAAGKITFDDTVTLGAVSTAEALNTGDLSINSAASWSINAATTKNFSAVFDSVGDVTLSGDEVAKFTSISSKEANAASSKGDVLTVANGGIVTIENNFITAVNSVKGSSQWTVASKDAAIGTGSSVQSWHFDTSGATLTANSRGTAISEAKFSKFATLTAASISGLTVGDDTWTVTGGEGKVTLASDGSASINAGSATVTGTDGASLHLHTSDVNSFIVANGATVASYDDNDIDLVLETKGTNAAISNINNVAENSLVQVFGDKDFIVNGKYSIASDGNGVDFQIKDSALVIEIEESGNEISIVGDSAYDVKYDKSGTSAKVNGVGVTLTASTSTGDGQATIYGTADDNGKVATVKGIGFGDTFKTDTNDNDYTLIYDVSKDFESGVVIVNSTQITIDRGDMGLADGAEGTLLVNYNGTNRDMPGVTLSPVTSSNPATIEATAGNYDVGLGRTGTIAQEDEDSRGRIEIGADGKVTISSNSVIKGRTDRQSLVGAADSLASVGANVPAYQTFYDLDKVAEEYASATTIHYNSADTGAVGTETQTSGVNLIGNTSLGADTLTAVTIQSYAANRPIYVVGREKANIRNVVIDAKSNGPSLVAVGMSLPADSADSIGPVNHTILGADSASTLMIGHGATGDNYIEAGSIGSYLYHQSSGPNGGRAVLKGGAGADTIAVGNSYDSVFGGGGADVFLDSNDYNNVSYTITDYDATQGDVIRATRLSSKVAEDSLGTVLDDLIVTNGHSIAVAGGPTITAGTDTSTSVGTNVLISDVNGNNLIAFAWANNEASTVNADSFNNLNNVDRVAIRSDNNDAADLVIGSSKNDTIFVSNGDTVQSNDGNDLIYMNAEDGEDGAMVEISAGDNSVSGWNEGFDHTDGADILFANGDNATINFGFYGSNDILTASIAGSSGSTVKFADIDNTQDQYEILVGNDPENPEKVLVLRSNGVVNNDSIVADRYVNGKNSGAKLTFTSAVHSVGDGSIGSAHFDDMINLNNKDKYDNINQLDVQISGKVSIIGTDGAETITAGGAVGDSSGNRYRKAVSLGGGNDLLISGGDSTNTAGVDIYFGSRAEGQDTVRSFGYYNSSDGIYNDSNDLLRLFNADNVSVVGTYSGDALNVNINLNSNSRLTIADHNSDKAIRYDYNADENEQLIKIGATTGRNNTFTYEEYVDEYLGNASSRRDTISIASGTGDVNIWLGNKSNDTVRYTGIGAINASADTNANLTLAGAAGYNNTIYGGGSGSHSSLWGGGGSGSNSLIGGSGSDNFYFMKSSSNDTIYGAEKNGKDIVWLDGITLSDLLLDGSTKYDSVADVVTVKLNSRSGGGSLTIRDASDVTINLADGSSYAATNSDPDVNGFRNLNA